MGVDITAWAEAKRKGKWERITHNMFSDYSEKTNEPFSNRDYGIFGFLANVRNYHDVPVICEARGFPLDSEWLNTMAENQNPLYNRTNMQEICERHWYYMDGWLSLLELIAFDYDKEFEDKRTSETTKMAGGGTFTDNTVTAEPGKGKMITFRQLLGENFFKNIEELKTLGEPDDVRIVFYFTG